MKNQNLKNKQIAEITNETEEEPDPQDPKLDDEIHAITIEIIKLHKKGLSLKDIPLQETKDKLFQYFKYIFSKRNRKSNEILLVKHYLSKFPKYAEIPESKDKDIMMTKICQCLKYQYIPNGQIICCLGEPGDRFYILFKGMVTVLVPQEYDFEMTERDYLKHLRRLYRMEEYEILKNTIYSNFTLNANNEFADVINSLGGHIKDHKVSISDYYDRMLPITAEEKENEMLKISKIKVKLWNYKKVCDIYANSTFGEVALMDNTSKRTASIISIEPCIFGVINKHDYQEFIKDSETRMRKNNIEILLSHSLFINIKEDVFTKYNLFNLFRYMEVSQGEYIVKSGDKRDEIYFIKEGQISIEMNANINNINTIINELGYKINDKQLEKLIKNNPYFRKLYNSINYYRLFNVDHRHIIGLNDYNFKGKYFCNAKVISRKCSMFALEIHFLDVLLKLKVIKENFEIMIPKRIEFMAKRLLELKNSFLKKYFNMIEINQDQYYDLTHRNLHGLKKRALKIKNTLYNNLDSVSKTLLINSSSKDFKHHKEDSFKYSNYISTEYRYHSPNISSSGSKILFSNENLQSLNNSNNNYNSYNNSSIIKKKVNLIKKKIFLPGIDLYKINVKTEPNEKIKENEKLESDDKHIYTNSENIDNYYKMKNNIVNKLIDTNSFRNNIFLKTRKAPNLDFLAFDKYVEKVEIFNKKKQLGWNGKKCLKNKFKLIPIE